MATPNVNVIAPQGPLLPGSVVEFTWTVVDADSRTIEYQWSGTDSQGNAASGSGSFAVQDSFTMESFTLGGIPLSIDNFNRRATGVVPSA